MKHLTALLMALSLLAHSSYGQLSTQKMMKIVTRDISIDIRRVSFGAEPKTLYRMGRTYGRLEEMPDPQKGLHLLTVVAEPRVWMINLMEGRGRLIIDPGPTCLFSAPIIPPEDSQQMAPLGDFEFGTEYDFMQSHQATMTEDIVSGKTYDKSSLSLDGYTITLLSHQGKQQPFRVTVRKGKTVVCQYEYDEYETDLIPDMDLFKPPNEVEIVEPRQQLPPFLPAYYAPAFSSRGAPLGLVSQSETNGAAEYVYSTTDDSLVLSVQNIEGDQPHCDAIFDNVLGYLNQLITSNQGSFVEITETGAHAEVILTNAAQTVFSFVLPSSVHIWTFAGPSTNRGPLGADFRTFRKWANRQRYEEALQAGNVSMGQWQKCIHDYAEELLAAGRRDEALTVLRNLLATAPFDYEAHLALMHNTPDAAEASNSAKTLVKNAEATGQIAEASAFIGAESQAIKDLPPLATNEAGLQVILIPLPPCNPWLLDETAKVYERITDVPVRIRRLNEDWSWGTPERISRQRYIQNLLVRLTEHNIDFTNWTPNHYTEALCDAVRSEDALSQYWVQDLVSSVKKEPGQYLVDPYLDRLCAILKSYRSKDKRTMYVAITEANIYSGDNNYVFSLGITNQESKASILSYYMMLGRTLQETYDSRQRLVERIAKELVPASLKQLGIPRSTDPTCPYSYSSGVDRLDQKTLTLADEVKKALSQLRDPTKVPSVP